MLHIIQIYLAYLSMMYHPLSKTTFKKNEVPFMSQVADQMGDKKGCKKTIPYTPSGRFFLRQCNIHIRHIPQKRRTPYKNLTQDYTHKLST